MVINSNQPKGAEEKVSVQKTDLDELIEWITHMVNSLSSWRFFYNRAKDFSEIIVWDFPFKVDWMIKNFFWDLNWQPVFIWEYKGKMALYYWMEIISIWDDIDIYEVKINKKEKTITYKKNWETIIRQFWTTDNF